MIGLKIYNKKKELQGTVTAKYKSDTDDKEVVLVDDSFEVEASEIEHVLWTLKPDVRGEHLRYK
ncbi:conserved hypothetical protein [Vibrio chagasii]|nr:conserved hypothetical protein [Vibrio chagasii]